MSHRGMDLDEINSDDWGFKGKNYLLAIGINTYSEWKPLNNAVKDAKDFIDVLKTTYQFEEQDIYTLFDEQATEDNIHDSMLNLVRTVKEEDNLLIYYSGHGHFIEELQQGYWVPVDAPKGGSVRKYISNSDLVNYLKNIKSHHTFLIVDSCFSGTLMTQLRSGVRSEKYPSRRIFASGRNEVVEDGVAGQNSPFAAGIINYLKRNNDRSLKTTTLIEDVKSYLERQEIKQTPVDGRIKSLGDDGGEFIFYLKKSEEDIWNDLTKENTELGYQKYLDFFPAGKYEEDAREMIHALKEEDFWQNIKRRNNARAYNEYISEYPGGKFSAEAFLFLEKIEENTSWAKALQLNSLSGFQKYLIKYPDGAHSFDAKQRIKKLEGVLKETDSELAQRKQELNDLIAHEQKLTSAKKRYRAVFDEAEKLFAGKNYGAARLKYLECQKVFQEGFEPDEQFLKNRLSESQKFEELATLYKSGKEAHRVGNFDLAIHYYQKAYAVHRSPKLAQLIKDASAKTSRKTIPAKPKKEKTGIGKKIFWMIIGAAAGLILLILAFNEEFTSGFNEGFHETSGAVTEDRETPIVKTSESDIQPPPKKEINFAQAVKGLWTITDVQTDYPEILPLFLNARYNFTDGIVYENAVALNYSVNGNQLNVNNGVVIGTISMSDKNQMTVSGNYNVFNVGSFPVVWTFRRI